MSHFPQSTHDAFAPVLAWLDAGAPHAQISDREDVGFNLDHFIVDIDGPYTGAWPLEDYASNECGTAVCIAGAIRLFNQGDFEFVDSTDGPITSVGNQLGMTRRQMDALFFADDGFGHAIFDLSKITPAQAAGAIRTMLETGIVVWPAGDDNPASSRTCASSETTDQMPHQAAGHGPIDA